ncbi:MAG: hypothetical protein CMP30_07040, partial [Roseibacillus sp.]|nr:hypothetical protein [Roseibacillus sp.]
GLWVPWMVGSESIFQYCPGGVEVNVEAGWNVFALPAQDIRSASMDRAGTVMMIRSNPDGFWTG